MSMLINPHRFAPATGGGGETLFIRSSETIIHDFNQLGGGAMSKLFDANTNQALGGGSSLPYKGGSAFAYFGITFSTPKRINRAVVHGSNDTGYMFNNNPSMTIDLYGKAGSAPSSSTDGTLLGSITFPDTANESTGREILSSDTSTNFDHVWARISTSSALSITAAELSIYTLASQ